MTDLPLIAIIGRPNVGKSTLFNCLVKRRQAIVADTPGVTRDRLEGEGRFEDIPFRVMDTGGLDEVSDELTEKMIAQTWQGADEADSLVFLVDGRAGVTPFDIEIANRLRKMGKPITLVVNKTDGICEETAVADFYQLGLGEPHPIAASHQKGIISLLTKLLDGLEPQQAPEKEEEIRIAVIGRPNVGKSTLINRLLGQERVVVCDYPGTTRDSIAIPFVRHDQRFVLIDTAGMRRKAKITDPLEQVSVRKTMDALEKAHVALMVMDAREKILDQDLTLLNLIEESGRSLVIVVNKWDNINTEVKENFKADLWRLHFVQYAQIHYISALHGTGVGNLIDAAEFGYRQANQTLSTSMLTQLLNDAVEKHQPPLVRGRRVKLRYAHCGGQHPLTVVVHGKQTKELPQSYQQYLKKYLMQKLKISGTTLRLVLKSDTNPYTESA
ncbi:MAG: ribosome biogenesis GTPase Der [Gammaproteobacteria bacterium]